MILPSATQRSLGPFGHRPLQPHVSLMGADERTLGSSSFQAPLNAPVILRGAASRALGPSEHRPTRPWSFRATPYATLCSPRWRQPTHPWSFWSPPHAPFWSSRAQSHAPLVLPGVTLYISQGTQLPPVCGGDRREKIPRWPQRKGRSCEIWIEKEKQKKKTHRFNAADPFFYPPPPVEYCVPSSSQVTTE